MWAEENPVYEPLREMRRTQRATGNTPGDPAATAQAILTLVDAANPPLRLFLGVGPLNTARAAYEQRLKTWEEWDAVSRSAQGS